MSRYIITGVKQWQAPLHVHPEEGTKYIGDVSSSINKEVNWCDILIVHGLNPDAAKVIALASSRVKVVWSGWGGDYYDLIMPVSKLKLNETKRVWEALYPSQHPRYDKYSVNVWEPLKRFKRSIFPNWKDIAARRVDFFSAPIPQDYELLIASRRNLNFKYLQLNYISVESSLQFPPDTVDGGDILIGNSATPANNHIEAFRLLSNLNLGERKVIVPLSYGDRRYREAVIRAGKDILGNNFEPLLDFMSEGEYHVIISRCSVVMMNHLRQQGIGNIGAMLYKGARVFLQPETTTHHFFKQREAIVFDINTIPELGKVIFEPLDEREVSRNREVLMGFWGHDKVIDNICKLESIV